MTRSTPLAFCIMILLLTGCVSTGSGSPTEKRAAINSMKTDTLNELYKSKPDVRDQIKAAAGYGVFSNANINLVFASFGGGYGVVTNPDGKRTYMNMGEVGLGFGLGIKDFRIVMVFHTSDARERFITSGWSFGGQADAAAKAGDKGGALAAEAQIGGVTVYSFTESGLALQATLKGTKFWVDENLSDASK